MSNKSKVKFADADKFPHYAKGKRIRRKLVKGFVTYVCCKCGNVARGTPHKTKEGYCKFTEEKEKCRVCNEYQWRECILQES